VTHAAHAAAVGWPLVVCVDIDGVLADTEGSQRVPLGGPARYDSAPPVKGAAAALRWLKAQGYRIHLYTGRHLDHLRVTQDWLARHGMEYDHLVMGKPPATYYIDDRAIRFESWEQVMGAL
jgi:hypothetical protein